MFLSILSALLLILAFPNFNLGFLAFVGFVPLFYALENKSPRYAFWTTYLCGVIFYFGVLYWLIHITLVGLIFLVLYSALYFGLFGLTLHFTLYTLHKPLSPRLLIIPAIWVVLEYLQANLFTGFGWTILGYSQFKNLPLIQISDMTGVYGVSFLIMFTNVGIKNLLSKKGPFLYNSLLLVIVFLLVIGYGLHRQRDIFFSDNMKASVIQGNIPQDIKWDPEAKEGILNKYIVLTKMAALDNPDLIIWPEASVPGYWNDKKLKEEVLDLARDVKIPILVGAITEKKDRYFNSAILISKDGEITEQYDKIHLVPFGEFVPFEKAFPKLRDIISFEIGDFTPGNQYKVFKYLQDPGREALNFSTLICFEDIFPALVRRFIQKGAKSLVVITNDAWFKKSSAPYQHAVASIFRAIENRRFVIRSTNTGFSCFIEPTGKVNDSVKDEKGQSLFVTGYKTSNVPIGKGLTFYTKFGDLFVGLCVIICLISFLRRSRVPFS